VFSASASAPASWNHGMVLEAARTASDPEIGFACTIMRGR